MTRLAEEHGAINLAQGFPDFDGPPQVIEAARAALGAGANQYARSMGRLDLTRAIARRVRGPTAASSALGSSSNRGKRSVQYLGTPPAIATQAG